MRNGFRSVARSNPENPVERRLRADPILRTLARQINNDELKGNLYYKGYGAPDVAWIDAVYTEYLSRGGRYAEGATDHQKMLVVAHSAMLLIDELGEQ